MIELGRRLWPKEWRSHWLIWPILLLAAVLRLWHLDSLPPGLTPAEAANGLATLNLIHQHRWWDPTLGLWQAAYSWLALPFIKIWGNTIEPLRIVAALSGIATVGGVYLWLHAWRGERDALIGGFLTAFLAWQIGISREATPAVLIPLILVWWLWLITRAYRTGRPVWSLASAAVLAAMLYVSPLLWWVVLAIIIWLVVRLVRHQTLPAWWKRAGLLWLILSAPALIWFGRNVHRLASPLSHQLLHNFGLAVNLFVVAGGDWHLSFGGQALLNAFNIIMFVLGLLMAGLHWRRYGWLIGLWLLALILAAADWPNAGNALALAIVPSLGLVVLGIATMLERWYATFPINSAARSVGQGIIGLLLVLGAYQGYVQYFVAFGDASETYQVYHDDYTAIASDARRLPQALVVADPAAGPIISYLNYPIASRLATPTQVKQQSLKRGQYLIGTAEEQAMIPILRSVAPGGVLRDHLSPFDGQELYFLYESK